jgi:hypothetical protein
MFQPPGASHGNGAAGHKSLEATSAADPSAGPARVNLAKLLAHADIESWLEARKPHMRYEYSSERQSWEGFKCTSVALKAAEMLIERGEEPRLLKFAKGDPAQAMFNPAARLNPSPFPEMNWWCHVVCESRGKVYDPMLGAPCELRDYALLAFEEEVPFREFFDAEKTARETSSAASYLAGDLLFRALIADDLPRDLWHLRADLQPAEGADPRLLGALTFRLASGDEAGILALLPWKYDEGACEYEAAAAQEGSSFRLNFSFDPSERKGAIRISLP